MNKQEQELKASKLKEVEKRYIEQTRKVNVGMSTVRYTIGRYAFYDFAMKSGTTYGLVESKIRKKKLEFFNYNAPMLERVKFNGMLECKNQILLTSGTNVDLYYFHYTADYYCQIFKLEEDRTKYCWVERYLPVDDFNPEIKDWKDIHLLTQKPIQVFKIW